MMKYLSIPALAALFIIAGCSTSSAPESNGSPDKSPAVKGSTSAKDFITSIDGLVLVKLEPGEFVMGSDKWSGDEKPAHKVKLGRSFWIGRTEITQSQYEKIAGKNPSLYGGKNAPAEQLSWESAVDFCRKLTESDKSRIPEGYAYRLPTEAEWEYACRAGTTGDYAGKIEDLAWDGSNSKNSTQEVATKSPNAWGIYDMHGNVWEWCLDSCEYGEKGVRTETFTEGLSDPCSTKGDFRVLKGGSWCFDKKFCRSSTRYADKPDFAAADIGFRIALAPEIKLNR
ncbi:MAG: hypothetical protein A2X45_12195 [Lentisphaerae bacterium GWF2_50_93]|nr:MAG: hypothetical protein A2X45_12195 [Lentisphaerae bacterium GWF2_50_93]